MITSGTGASIQYTMGYTEIFPESFQWKYSRVNSLKVIKKSMSKLKHGCHPCWNRRCVTANFKALENHHTWSIKPLNYFSAYLTSNKKIEYTFISRTSGRTERKHACEAVQSIISSYKLVCYSVKFDNLVPGPIGHCLNAWQYLGQVRQVSSPPDELLVLIKSLITPGAN